MRKQFEVKETVEEMRKRIEELIEKSDDVVGAKVAQFVNSARATFVEKGYAAGFRWGEDADGKVTLSIEGKNNKAIEAIYNMLYGKETPGAAVEVKINEDGIRYCKECYTPCSADDKVCKACGAKIRD